MNRSIKLFSALVVVLMAATLIIPACGPEKAPDEKDPDSTVTADTGKEAVSPKAKVSKLFKVTLPSVIHIAKIFDKAGVKYSEELALSTDSASKYETRFEKSLSLGVYTTDLAYAAYSEKNKESLEYLKIVKRLSSDLGLSSIFESGNLVQRFEKNINSPHAKDSMIVMLTQLQMEKDLLLQETEQVDVFVFSFAGAFIESMYIGTKVSMEGDKAILMKKVAEQKIIIGKLIMLLEDYTTDPASGEKVKSLIEDFKSIETLLKAIDTENVDKAKFEELTKKMAETRAKYI